MKRDCAYVTLADIVENFRQRARRDVDPDRAREATHLPQAGGLFAFRFELSHGDL
jgi:hypothetical protein